MSLCAPTALQRPAPVHTRVLASPPGLCRGLDLKAVAQIPVAARPAVRHGGTGGAGQRGQQQRAAALPPLFHLASADVIYAPTGVPLVDELMKLGSVGAAAQHSARLLAFLAAVALLGGLTLKVAGAAADRRIQAAGETQLQVKSALVAAAFRPCKVMLPLYCATRAATVVLALAEVAATLLNVDPATAFTCGVGGRLVGAVQWCTLAAGAGNTPLRMLPALQWFTQLVQDCSELVLIVGLAWAALNFKSRLIAWQTRCIQLDSDPHNDGAVPLLRLLSGGLSVLIVMCALGVTLVGFGFHIGPLMASVGGVSVVVGLVTQQLLANLVAAVSLFVTRPFVTGDEVQLITPEGVEVTGTVLSIEPTRTILWDAGTDCIIHINNADVSDFIIRNYTQNRNLSRLQELQAGSMDRPSLPSSIPPEELALATRTGEFDEWEGPASGADEGQVQPPAAAFQS